MAGTLGTLLLMAGSVLAAACALFWPQIEQAYLAHHTATAAARGSTTAGGNVKGKCPLGYEGPMPAHHPPIQPGAGSSSSNTAKLAATAPGGSQRVTFANASIWTADVQHPWAVNMTVDLTNGDILAMGYPSSSSSSSGKSAGRVVDMQGAFLMPGFVDPHVHLIPGGLFLSKVNLRGLQGGRAEMAQRVAAAAAAATAAAAAGGSSSSRGSSGGDEPSPWLLGIGWSESDWGGELPHRTWIDEACGGRPAFLSRMDSHMGLANTAALAAAGLLTPPSAAAAAAAAAAAERPRGAGDDDALAAALAAADAGGLIDRDPVTGLPTGLLRESAMHLVERLIPTPSVADRAAALQAAGRHLLSRGVTSVGDMGWGLFGAGDLAWQDLEAVYDVAAVGGSMPLRVSVYLPLRTWPRLASRIAAQGRSHPSSTRLLWGGTKEFADGSLGSSTALMWEPYAGTAAAAAAATAAAGTAATAAAGSSGSSGSSEAAPGDVCAGGGEDAAGSCQAGSDSVSSSSSSSQGHSSGTRTILTDELSKLIQGAAGAGLQVAVHAIGDRAVDEVVEAFEQAALSSSSSSNSRAARLQHRIEHVQHISSPAAAARMAALGLAAVPNPQHLLTDRYMLVTKLGFERAGPGRAFAYKTLGDAGVRLGFGSDWPVVGIDPWESVYAAVHRRAQPAAAAAVVVGGSAGGGGVVSQGSGSGMAKGEEVWESESERLELSEVLLGHTLEAARVARLDHWVGQLAPGFKADFVVLDRSPFSEVLRSSGDVPPTAVAAAAADSSSQDSGLLLSGVPRVQQTYMDGVCVVGCDRLG